MDGMNNNNFNMGEVPDGKKTWKDALKYVIPAAVFLVLVLILVVVAAATGAIGGNKRKIVENAWKETLAQSEKGIKDGWQLDEYADMFQEKQMHMDADLDIEYLGNMEIQMDSDGTQRGGTIGIGYNGAALFEVDFYADREELRVGIPGMTDYVFYVDFATYAEDVEEFIQNYNLYYGIGDALRSLPVYGGLWDADAGKAAREETLGRIKEACDDISVKVRKAQSKRLPVNGTERSCKGYVITLDNEDVAGFVATYKTLYEENEIFRNYLDRQMGGAAQAYDEVMENLDMFMESCEEAGSLEIYCYICDDVLAQVTFDNDTVSFEWNIYGGSFPLENMDFILSCGRDDFALARSGNRDGSDYQAEYTISSAGNEMGLSVDYDNESGEIGLELKFGYYTLMLLEGNLEKTIPGRELTVEIDTFVAAYEEILCGSVSISNECGEIEKPEGRLTNVLQMMPEDWEKVLSDIDKRLY